MASPQKLPTILCCIADGTSEEISFFVDIDPQHIESCLELLHYSSQLDIRLHLLSV
ncbi:uncharacterized protein BJX67DRAFT_342771 [Aspergillus lucknowensis]|uniref:Uncharacterized protein n=1 Tax=Aspergillus lucknowensis TaxID=176173 RepID=A0ABR4M4Y7_9EURO